MAQDDHDEPGAGSAPDLRILGDEITLHPSGFVEPEQNQNHSNADKVKDKDREEALMEQFASFRAEPLQ